MVDMATTSRHSVELNFLPRLEKASGKTRKELHEKMGWSRQRYDKQRTVNTFEPRNLAPLRKALGWSRHKFYSFLAEHFGDKNNP